MSTNQTMPITASVDEAARLSGLSRSTIYKLLREGKVSGRRRGRATLVLIATLNDYLSNLPEWAPTVGTEDGRFAVREEVRGVRS